MADYWLEHPEAFNGQPKRAIGDYVEQNGILVPRRFDSLKEAKASGLPVIARSEHPQEYDGVSGLFGSYNVDEFSQATDEKHFAEIAFERERELVIPPNENEASLEIYCNLTGCDRVRMRGEVSFSFWEHLGGFNRTVIADSSIPNRYHVLAYREKPHLFSYTIVENGHIVSEFVMPLVPELRENMPQLIELYENVRSLSRFDAAHCPIIEVQTAYGKHYFLQYHRSRDFKQTNFELDREQQKGEIVTPFVRGATQPEGILCKTTVEYSNVWKKLPQEEEGAFDFHYNHINHIFSELMVRKRKLQVTHIHDDFDFEMMKFVVKHDRISKLHKPEVSVMQNIELLIEDDERESLWKRAKETGEDQNIPIHVISDGRKAYISRV